MLPIAYVTSVASVFDRMTSEGATSAVRVCYDENKQTNKQTKRAHSN